MYKSKFSSQQVFSVPRQKCLKEGELDRKCLLHEGRQLSVLTGKYSI